jgi:hypothetical protein
LSPGRRVEDEDVPTPRTPVSIGARLSLLARQASTLRQIRDDQETLVAGTVSARESWQRLSQANRINEACQRLQMELVMAGVHHLFAAEVAPIRALAETVLRENAILQARGPLYVIRSADVPNRFVLNRAGGRELRKGFGLHRRPRNDEGPSVVVAFTPPGHEQMWHAHTVDEYTLALDARFAARYIDAGIHTLEAEDGQLCCFRPHTYHTLANRGTRVGRTITLKYPVGISVWLPGLELTGRELGSAEVRSPSTRRVDDGMGQIFEVRDQHHAYGVAILQLEAGGRLDLPCRSDTYVYVLDGCVEVRRGRDVATAASNDLIVAEPPRTLRLHALTEHVRLYWPSLAAKVPLPASDRYERREQVA